jgi:hypothetical protein
MSPYETTAVIVSIITIIGAFGATVRFLVKHYLYELKPNSGSSLNDRVRKLEGKVDQIYYMLITKEEDHSEDVH